MFDLNPGQDGKVVLEIEIDGKLKPGERRPRPSGVTGAFFVQSDPRPVKVDSLNGQWQAALGIDAASTVETGAKAKYVYLEKRFTLPAKDAWPSKRPFLESPTHLGWVILNGHVVSTPGIMNRFECQRTSADGRRRKQLALGSQQPRSPRCREDSRAPPTGIERGMVAG